MNTRELLFRFLGKETISPAAKKAGDSVKKLGDDFKATAEDSKRLDREIEKSKANLAQLAVAFARTQDATERVDLSRSIRKQQSELRKLTKAKDLVAEFAEAGAKAANGFGAQFVTRVGPILARAPMHPAGLAIGAALAAGILPPLMAALGGAVLATAVAGAVVGGVVLASRDVRVKQAGRDLGETVMSDLDDIGARFVGPTLKAIGILKEGWRDVRSDVDGAAAAASRFVEPLTRGVVGLVRELLPGLRSGLEKAGPIARELELGFTRVGRTVGELFRQLGENSSEGAAGLRWVFLAIDDIVKVTGWAIDKFGDWLRGMLMIADAAGKVASMWSWIPVLGDQIDRSNSHIDEMRAALDGSGEAGETAGANIFDGLKKAADGASSANREVKSLTETLRELREQTASAIDAEIAFERSLDDVAAAAKKANGGIDLNTEAGRRNMEQLRSLHESTKRYADAIRERTGSEDQAAAVTEKGRKAFIANAQAMGVSKKEAKDLATQLFGIPNISREVTVKTDSAAHNVRTLRGLIAAIKSKRVVITAVTRSEGRAVPIGDGIGGRASGGPVKKGQTFWVGERGPELVTFSRDGWVHDAQKSKRMTAPKMLPANRSSGGGSSNQPPVVQIDLTGGEEAYKTWIRSMLRRNPNLLVVG